MPLAHYPRSRQPRGSAAGADLALAPKHATRTTYPRRMRAPKITTRPDQGLEQPIPAPLSDSGHDSPHLPAHPPRGLGAAPPQHRCASLPPTYRHTRGRSEGWRARERRLSWPSQRPTAAARRSATNKPSATCWGCPTAPPIWATSAADLVDLRTDRHNPIPATCEGPHTSRGLRACSSPTPLRITPAHLQTHPRQIRRLAGAREAPLVTLPTLRRSSAADGNAKAKRYMLVVPNGTADLGDLRAMPTNPCTDRHNPISAVTEGPHTSCRVRGGTVQPSHAGRTARPGRCVHESSSTTSKCERRDSTL